MRIFILLIISVLLVACSGKPKDSEIKSQVIDRFIRDGGDEVFEVFEIKNFQKIDGFERDSKTYVANVRYELVFKKGIKELAETAKSAEGLGGAMSQVVIMMLVAQYGYFNAGEAVLKEEKVILMKTENGWHIVEEGSL
jgi:hypothetical protein